MNGIFSNHSSIKQVDNSLIEESNITRYSSNSNSTYSNSSNSYSPPIISPSSTPQRVQRKPVSNNPILRSSPQKNYHAADTIHPNRMKPILRPNASTIISSSSPLPSSNTEKYIRTRSYSQGSSKSEPKPTFWYPRIDNKKDQPLKRGFSKKIRGLLQPNRVQIEQGASNDQYIKDCQYSLKRSNITELDIKQNPFHILSYTHNETDKSTILKFKELDFTQVDNYAMTVQQRGPLLTPTLLSQKFLVRPYKNDLFRLRALFIWLIQNIRPDYHRNDLISLQKQLQPSKSTNNIRQRLSRSNQLDDDDLIEKLDTMDLLQEEFNLLSTHVYESPENVLETRSCKSSFGMAHLFTVMAIAAGFKDAKVIHGYLKAPKDTNSLENKSLTINHSWCSIKIDNEYRFIDCWLASPFYPQNDSKIEPHWFLTQPIDFILSHLPQDPSNQFLNLPLTQYAFFNLPLVRNPFFWYNLQVIHFKNQLQDNNSVYYLSLKLDSNISCYAETEGEDGTIIRGLAQCLNNDRYKTCEIKAVLPPHQTQGWLKIYVGPKLNRSNQQMISKNHYSLTMCIPIQQEIPELGSFDFVQLYHDHNEFYIQEPQCYQLYPLQKYSFCVRGNRLDNRASHHKLAIKSPNGKLVKLMYYPQDQTYDGTLTISEVGKWSLICLLHHTGGWYTVASWYCSITK